MRTIDAYCYGAVLPLGSQELNMLLTLLAKKNQDGSFSVSIKASDLIGNAFVDFYDDTRGTGYQRNETLRTSRGREIAEYVKRCSQEGVPPRLFELTANARVLSSSWSFEPLDAKEPLGFLRFDVEEGEQWLSIIDGGTRLLGIQNALGQGSILPTFTVDARIFIGLSLGEEVAQFLLINEKQKRVRTDLSLRLVQRKLDDDQLSDLEKRVLQTVVPDEDSWMFEASRLAGALNADPSSPWCGLIQMPNDQVTKPVKLQAFLTSLKPILTNGDLDALLKALSAQGQLRVGGHSVGKTEFIAQVLKNFWAAVGDVNPEARDEPHTTVLWGSIGVSACHIGLAPILASILDSSNRQLSRERFKGMLGESMVADYPFWWTRQGARGQDAYPAAKGEATERTGAANYVRLGKQLETKWRAALHVRDGHEAASA